MGRDRERDYKEAEELLGMRNMFVILTVVMCTQRSNCTDAADRWSKMRTENWPFNSATWWSSVTLRSSFGGARGIQAWLERVHERTRERDSRQWVQTTLSRDAVYKVRVTEMGPIYRLLYVNYSSINQFFFLSRWTNNWLSKPELVDLGAGSEEKEAIPSRSANTTPEASRTSSARHLQERRGR